MNAPSSASFDWSLLQSFLAVLDHGSFLAAARSLGVQQPTLSRRIALLEDQLGTPLFERTGRGGVPTAAARAIASAARAVESSAAIVARDVQQLRASTTGTVRITTSHVAATWLLPPVLVELQRNMPGLQLELLASNDIRNLIHREADIAVRLVRPTQRSLIARKLGDIPIIAAAHTDYLSRHGSPSSIDDLLRHQLIGFDQDPSMIRGFAALGLNVTREHFTFRTDDQVAHGQLLASGAGIGFVTAYNLSYWPGVVPLLPSLTIPPLPCWLVAHREIQGNALLRAVFDDLAHHIPRVIAPIPAPFGAGAPAN